jgi:GT2 family glycosyltransferase
VENIDKGLLKKILIYVPSITGKIESKSVEGLMELCFEAASLKDYEFSLQVGQQMFIENARNLAVDYAIENNYDYILWVDDDMVVMPNSMVLTRLLAHDKDIVAPLFFTRKQPYMPLLFDKVVRADGCHTVYDHRVDYKKGLEEVDAVGFGMVLTKVEVFKKIGNPYFVFTSTFGEDVYFCAKAKSCGYKVYCDTTIDVGHIGDSPVIFEGHFLQTRPATELYLKQKKEADEAGSKAYEARADIVMPIYHNMEVTKNAIESLLNNTIGEINLILINDGADREVRAYIKQLMKFRKNIVYIENKTPVGWTKSVNMGLSKSTMPVIAVMNNDIEIPSNMKHWLQRVCSIFRLDNTVGGVCTTSDYVMGLQNIRENSRILMHEHYTKLMIGFFFCIKREVYEKIGGLDDIFGTSGNDDLDYSIRITKAGYKMKVARDIFIHHVGSCSLKMVNDNLEEMDKESRKVLVKKWSKEEADNLFLYTEKYLSTGEM